MRKLARRLAILLCTLWMLPAASAHAQLQPIPYTVTGFMGFAMHTEFAAATQNLAIHHSYVGYTAPTHRSLGGFPVTSGTLIGGSGYGTGDLICSGDLQFASGSLVMDLRDLDYSNTFAGITISAAVYLNSVYQGRQVIFDSQANELGFLTPGTFLSGNSYLVIDPAFQKVFVNFFQVPQLLNDPSFASIGFVFFSLNVQPS